MAAKPTRPIRTGAASPLPQHHPARIEANKMNVRNSAASPLPRAHPARTQKAAPQPTIRTGATSSLPQHHPVRQEIAAQQQPIVPKPGTAPDKKSFGSTVKPHALRVVKGPGAIVNHASGPVLWIFVAAVVIMFMANKNGASINMERAMVGGFFLTLVLMAIGTKSPGLAIAFASLILIEVILSYGPTAFKNWSKIGTGTQATPQIASTGATAGAAASLGAVVIGAEGAKSLIGGLGNLFQGNGAPIGGKSGSKTTGSTAEEGAATEGEVASQSTFSKIWGGVKSILGGGEGGGAAVE